MFIFQKVRFWCELIEVVGSLFPPALGLFQAATRVKHFAYTSGAEYANVNSRLIILRNGRILRVRQRIIRILALLLILHLHPFILLVVFLLILFELLKLSHVIVVLLIITQTACVLRWSRRSWWRTDHMLIVDSDSCARWDRTRFLVRRLQSGRQRLVNRLNKIGEAVAPTTLHVPCLQTLRQLLLAIIVVLLGEENVVCSSEHATVWGDLGAAYLVQVGGVAVGVGRRAAILRVDQR